MSISAIKTKKTVANYVLITLLTILVNRIYGLFGHGVHSSEMTFMFLYPFLGGAVFYLLIGIMLPNMHQKKGYRTFFNAYNSGIGALTLGSFLRGILDIAGTDSRYVQVFYVMGTALILFGIIQLLVAKCRKKNVPMRQNDPL